MGPIPTTTTEEKSEGAGNILLKSCDFVPHIARIAKLMADKVYNHSSFRKKNILRKRYALITSAMYVTYLWSQFVHADFPKLLSNSVSPSVLVIFMLFRESLK